MKKWIMLGLSIMILMIITGCGYNQKIEPIENSYQDKEFFATKFGERYLAGGEPIEFPPASFLEYDRPWYKMEVKPISKYYAVYLNNNVYKAIVDALSGEYNQFKTTLDGVTYFKLSDFNYELLTPLIKPQKIKVVDGSMAETYFMLSRDEKIFRIDDQSKTFQQLMDYQNYDITIDSSNYEIVEADNLSDLPIHYNNSYTAMAYFYYQEYVYTYNYQTNEVINEVVPYYGAMRVTSDYQDAIYHNLLAADELYIMMDIPLYLSAGCEPLEKPLYNIDGEKEFVAFSIKEFNNKDYIALSDNEDIETVRLQANGENYDILFHDKVINNKTYYSVDELVSVKEEVLENRLDAYNYNSNLMWSTYRKMNEDIKNSIIDCFKVYTAYDMHVVPEEGSVVASGSVIFETVNDVSSIDRIRPHYIATIGITTIDFGQFKVTLTASFQDYSTDYLDLIFFTWEEHDGVNQLIINYDESLIGQVVRIWYGYPSQKYHFQYISYYGATIDCYFNSVLDKHLFINLG